MFERVTLILMAARARSGKRCTEEEERKILQKAFEAFAGKQ